MEEEEAFLAHRTNSTLVSDEQLGITGALRRELREITTRIDVSRKRGWMPPDDFMGKEQHKTEIELKNQRRRVEERLRELEDEENQ